MNPDKYDPMYMQMAHVVASYSLDKRLKVGCIFVKDRVVLVEGFNGMLAGSNTNICEDDNGNSNPELVHAEGNAIMKAAKIGRPLNGSTVYVTHQPCLMCARQLIGVGVKEVVWGISYKCKSGMRLLEQFNVKTRELKI